MEHRWFDNWKIKREFHNDATLKRVTITVPYSYGNGHTVSFRSVSDARVAWMIDLLDCALTELSHIQREKELKP